MSALVHLKSASSEAWIDPAGAEAVDWRVGGRKLLWTADPAIWARTAPILFPIVGRARDGNIRVADRLYPMLIHGFAASSMFDVVERSEYRVRLGLRDSPETRASFPFPFRLDIEYRVTPAALTVALTVRNPGDGDLPYAAGWHPGFAFPFSDTGRAGHVVEFEKAEPAEVPVITAAGLFSPARRTIPIEGNRLPITDDLMAREALCFLNTRSRSVRLIAPDGAAIRVDFEDFPHLALWSRDSAPFLCIEAWTGYGDPDGFDGDIFAKPSMRILPPGGEARHTATTSFEGAQIGLTPTA